MSSTSPQDDLDYTDGASAQDIQNVIRETPRGRGDLQVASSYQPRRSMSSFRDQDEATGSIFDGPGSVTIPSSVTGLRRSRTRSFLSRSRRGSHTFESSSQISDRDMSRPMLSRRGTSTSVNAEAVDSDQETSSPISERRRGRQRRSTEENDNLISPGEEGARRTSMFGNLVSFFGRRESPSRLSHTSRSRRGSIDYAQSPTEEEGEDRWGYHSSEEDASDDETTSLPGSLYPASSRGSNSRPVSPVAAFPGLGRDPIFGDTRIDMTDVSTVKSLPITTGPPSHQDIYLEDEDLKIRVIGYTLVRWRKLLWDISTLFSLGLLGLLGLWFPEFWLRCTAKRRPFSQSETNLVVIEVSPCVYWVHGY
jgi:cation-transporting ATPase 13A2